MIVYIKIENSFKVDFRKKLHFRGKANVNLGVRVFHCIKNDLELFFGYFQCFLQL